jgi:outer membrane lipoprotein-sorting protein
MCGFSRLAAWVVVLVSFAACSGRASLPDAEDLLVRTQGAWAGDWHAVWQIEWDGAPLREPLVAEVWHAEDGQLRIETLEASSPALNGMILVDDGQMSWLYKVRQDQLEVWPGGEARIPLASDALDVVDWMLLSLENAGVDVSGRDLLESGLATRLDIILTSGDRLALWVDEETGMPARLELRASPWGRASLVARSVSSSDRLHPGLFAPPR